MGAIVSFFLSLCVQFSRFYFSSECASVPLASGVGQQRPPYVIRRSGLDSSGSARLQPAVAGSSSMKIPSLNSPPLASSDEDDDFVVVVSEGFFFLHPFSSSVCVCVFV